MATSQHLARPPLWTAQLPLQEDGTHRIRRLLIANRGEISCRVIKTCRLLDIISIAIYADEDANSRHVSDADHAVNLGSMDQLAGNPFLNIPLLIKTATDAGANAIHPGYGYLSENSQFADAVRAAGILFIGPSSTAMSTLGDKRKAKEYLAEHEPTIPLIPGWTGGDEQEMDFDELDRQAESIGYPIMIKASAGGGGKGMRVVHEASTLRAELERAQSESQRSFGSSECILEKYIEAGKHVEVQIIGDSHGTVLSLWERDCSVQRRHQKVIEETPCRWLSQEQREAMCAAAVRIGKLLAYENAGTVEFILDIRTGKFYFLEVNARLQVEHPITEECTGVDIVSIQLFVAVGGNLAEVPQLQRIPQNGHAIECRLCAEDPIRDFAPQHGLIRLWSESSPASRRDVRFETALDSGTRVSIYFDSMIAKIVVWAPTRSMAIEKMARTLAETACIGPATNQLFLQSCLLHEGFRRPDYTTSFVPENIETLLKNPYAASLGTPLSYLSVIPSIFLRDFKARATSRAERQIFGSIRRSFRNQRFDKINLPCDIVTAYDAKEGSDTNPHVCFWGFEPQTSAMSYTVQVAPLTVIDSEETKDGVEPVGPNAATKTYNALSASVRQSALPDAASLKVRVHDIEVRNQGNWRTGLIRISIDGKTLVAHVASAANDDEPDVGGSTNVFVHLPALGAPVDYRCYSVLAYFESLRHVMGGGDAASSKVINAPMPCKVLRVLKKNGEAVKTGELVMVVESMKMEITISAGREGKFETSVKEGDAVDEGVVLCTLE
ncbi:hypothetical protein AJ80_07611 [Polytolypa hystricis UAMH7299]|uniref:Uncharacterized protein n=1 Tax=Polytolypa hystricis (strain UAMH7299) TaxID=1447883 RepID=A0A2B7XM90_POLH7|nr:hypothetical protein AJ80_07611 [Polytolypa hystricis UAMH7299]